MNRSIVISFVSEEMREGVGARVRRAIGIQHLPNLDPFLMLDEFFVKLPAGFPDHPHRGFETVTYMLEGSFHHEDFEGHKGKIGPGDLQWMTAGRGIVHAEMPDSEDIVSHGLQLWVNLKSKDKMIEPSYQEFTDANVPRVNPKDGVQVKILAGEAFGTRNVTITRTPTLMLDFKMETGTTIDIKVPGNYRGFLYVLSGAAEFGANNEIGLSHTLLVLGESGDSIPVVVKETCHFVLIAGEPVGEKVYKHGPFVMNNQSEIVQAMNDFRSCSNGFENARSWKSHISSWAHK